MICLDTNVLIYGMQGRSRPEPDEVALRSEAYIASLLARGVRVMIPAPVLAEYLAGFMAEEHDGQRRLLDRLGVFSPLDANAAQLAALLTHRGDEMR